MKAVSFFPFHTKHLSITQLLPVLAIYLLLPLPALAVVFLSSFMRRSITCWCGWQRQVPCLRCRGVVLQKPEGLFLLAAYLDRVDVGCVP